MIASSDIAIIGGGITGLTAAYLLGKTGKELHVFESSERAGGVIRSHREGAWLAEEGPNTIMARSQKLLDLVSEVGLHDELVFANPEAAVRYVVRDREPKPLPDSPKAFLQSDLFSTKAKLRLLVEPFIRKWDNAYEESLAQFVSRRLGREFLDYAINPFVAGVYAGTPDRLSVKHAFEKLYELEQEYGSLIWGQIRGAKARKNRADKPKIDSPLFSLKDGLRQLPAALADKVRPQLTTQARITSIQKIGDHWELSWHKDGTMHRSRHRAVVFTAPIHALSTIALDVGFTVQSTPFGTIYYPPLSVLALGFEKGQVAHPLDGFGMLVPEVEPFKILGSLFSSTLFPHRAPEGMHLLTTFVGGARYPKLATPDHDATRDLVMADLRRLIGVQGEPVFQHFVHWPKAIPQYNLGYGEIKSWIDAFEESAPGFLFGGNYRYGISVSDCLNSGFTIRDRVIGYLEG